MTSQEPLLNGHAVISGHRIATGIHGGGTPLVLVHGTPAHAILWRELVPLFVGAFRRAEELALAMDARCYRGGAGRTRMKQLKYGRNDALSGLAMLLLLAAVIALNAIRAF